MAEPAAPWWHRAVVYQVYPRSFADSNGDGIGDLPGILGKLDYFAELGVDVLWVSPFYRSPMVDNGYDISDYTAVDPLFGTLADVDALIAGLHERGIRLMIDVVINHTSDQHPWFQASASSRDDPKRDWYWWRPPRPGHIFGEPGAEPTNWSSFFSEPAWTGDARSSEYFLHLFARQQPDLNWENPRVRAAVHEMLRWWLDRGVDGFRLDVINLISKDTALPDGKPAPAGMADGSAFYTCGPRVHEFSAELRREVWADRQVPLITVAETPGATLADAQLFSDPARGEFDMVFQFEHMSVDHGPGGRYDVAGFDLVEFKRVFGRWAQALHETGWNSLYLANHDQPRPASRYGDGSPASAKAIATMMHLHPGTPFVYQGEEIGMTNYPFTSIEQYDDIESLNYYRLHTGQGADPQATMAALAERSRDHARTPMQWDGGENAGFSTVTPWLPVNPNHRDGVNVAAQVHDAESVWAHYRELISLRHELDIVVHGDFEMLLPDDPRVYAYRRTLDGDRLTVLVNLSPDAVPVTGEIAAVVADFDCAELILGSCPGEVLPPWYQAAVLTED